MDMVYLQKEKMKVNCLCIRCCCLPSIYLLRYFMCTAECYIQSKLFYPLFSHSTVLINAIYLSIFMILMH